MNKLKPKRFSEEQKDAAYRILYNFDSVNSVILLAQMQSGKSDTYYFVAFECIRQKMVDHVVIVLGFSDKELVEQTKDYSSSWDLYDAFLEETIGLCRDDRNDLRDHIKVIIDVVYGTELTNPSRDEFNNTLFIWDESHYAQNQLNRPFKYMNAIGVPVNGDMSILTMRNNFVLSVSATPCSEISDKVHENQQKAIVMMQPGKEYIGVEQFYEKKKIIGFKDWKKELPKLFLEQKAEHFPSISIVRVHGNNAEVAIKIAIDANIAYEVYDGEQRALTKKSHDATKMQSLNDLKNPPSVHKCVIIKGMLRMGKRLEKPHISFVMETSQQSNTDVVLQGLLGRVCGYHINPEIRIYISDAILKITGTGVNKMNEIERYIKMMKGTKDDDITTMPMRATNLMGGMGKPHVWEMAVPIVVPPQPKLTHEEKKDKDAKEYRIEKLKKHIEGHILNKTANNSNGPDATHEIANQFSLISDKNLIVKKINKNKTTVNETFREMPQLLSNSISNGISIDKTPSGCGFASDNDTLNINVWEFNTNEYRDIGFPDGTLVVCARTKIASNKKFIPRTTGLEAFTISREDGDIIEGNGAFTIHAPVDTCNNVDIMQQHIINMITVSRMDLRGETMPRCITSNQVEGNKWKGIIVNSVVQAALEKNGVIYNFIFENYGEKIKIKKVSGKTPECLIESGKSRLSKIEW